MILLIVWNPKPSAFYAESDTTPPQKQHINERVMGAQCRAPFPRHLARPNQAFG